MAPEETDRGERRVAAATFLLGAVLFVGLAAWLVPWHAVPGGPVNPVSEHAVFSDAQIARAESYSSWARVWSRSALGASLLVVCVLGLTRRGRRVVDLLPGPWWVQVPLGVLVVTVLTTLAGLPFAIALQDLQRSYGLSAEPWPAYAVDVGLGVTVSAVPTALGLLVVVACARRWRRAWPAAVATLAAALVVAGSFAYPVVVEPLFNHFEPLPDGALRSDILALAATEGVHVDDVLVSDASRRTTTLNAYVSGFGGTRRVVLYDTTVSSLPPDQVEVIVAHELAHASHGDVLHGTLIGAAGGVAGVGLLGLIGSALRRRGLPGLQEAAAVPLALALVALATFLASPIENGISRQIETRADVASLEATQDPPAFVAVQRQLALRSLADPSPPGWSQWWFGNHPTVLTRLALASRVH